MCEIYEMYEDNSLILKIACGRKEERMCAPHIAAEKFAANGHPADRMRSLNFQIMRLSKFGVSGL